MQKLDNSFITYASDILADTNSCLTGMNIVELCNSYAVDFNKTVPHSSYPFEAKNKRTALKENLLAFDAAEQFRIIKEICDLPGLCSIEEVQELKIKLFHAMVTWQRRN